MAEEANTPSAGDNKACSDGGSGEDECGNGEGTRTEDRRNPYAMEVDRGRNCYACRGLGHLAHHCRNQGGRVAKGRRIEYNRERDGLFEYESNIKGEENLDTLN